MNSGIWEAVRGHYDFLTPKIIERSELHGPSAWVDPYCAIPWVSIMSPIELEMWDAIRRNGKVPLYPQYPVFDFFIDFGNPFLKLGVECDGKEFHKDKQKDADREIILKNLGWRLIRITGSDCYTKEIDEMLLLLELDLIKS